MKLFYKFLLTLMILSLAIPFFLKRPDGQPLLSLANIGQDLSTLGNGLKNTILSSVEKIKDTPQTTTLYRWQDAQGQWHFSNSPRETSQPFKVTPNSSIQAPRQAQPADSTVDSAVAKQTNPQSIGMNEALPLPLSAKQAIKTLEDAKNIQKLMDNRTDQLDEAIRQSAQ